MFSPHEGKLKHLSFATPSRYKRLRKLWNLDTIVPMYDLIVIGGGAAGMFAALSAKAVHPTAKVALLEKSAVLLAKVRVSGGGRCNVTHLCFDPANLAQHYPRGGKELRGPFHKFQPKDTLQWFESRGTALKSESDGRVFPVTDSSETIINTLLNEAKSAPSGDPHETKN